MRFDIVTIFPEFFSGPLDHGIVRRAREAAIADVRVHDLRQFTHDRHLSVDDRPFGGGEGMVLKPEPLFEAVETILGEGGAMRSAGRMRRAPTEAVVLLSASGKLFRQETARRYAQCERIVLLCGRYEGVDERVAEHLASDEISIGDFVLTGGELPAAILLDAVTRLLPGALGNEASSIHESFSAGAAVSDLRSAAAAVPPVTRNEPARRPAGGPARQGGLRLTSYVLLDCPHYTRPQLFRSWAVPEVLVSGNHEQIRRWRRKMALAKTARNRPDLLASAALSDEDRLLLAELRSS